MIPRIPGFAMVLALSLVTGCASVSSDLNFHAPAGWSSTPSLFGRAQVWVKSAPAGNQNETLMLIRGRAGHPDIFYNPQMATSSTQGVKHDVLSICGSQRADHYTGNRRDNNGRVTEMEAVSIVAPNQTRYVAVYMRPSGMAPDPQAERALRSLCLKNR